MPEITKRRVTMTNAIALPEGKVEMHVATDYVRPDHIDAYVADAKLRWQLVEISDEPDAGPAGFDGATFVPAHLPLPDAGVTYPATGA